MSRRISEPSITPTTNAGTRNVPWAVNRTTVRASRRSTGSRRSSRMPCAVRRKIGRAAVRMTPPTRRPGTASPATARRSVPARGPAGAAGWCSPRATPRGPAPNGPYARTPGPDAMSSARSAPAASRMRSTRRTGLAVAVPGDGPAGPARRRRRDRPEGGDEGAGSGADPGVLQVRDGRHRFAQAAHERRVVGQTRDPQADAPADLVHHLERDDAERAAPVWARNRGGRRAARRGVRPGLAGSGCRPRDASRFQHVGAVWPGWSWRSQLAIFSSASASASG